MDYHMIEAHTVYIKNMFHNVLSSLSFHEYVFHEDCHTSLCSVSYFQHCLSNVFFPLPSRSNIAVQGLCWVFFSLSLSSCTKWSFDEMILSTHMILALPFVLARSEGGGTEVPDEQKDARMDSLVESMANNGPASVCPPCMHAGMLKTINVHVLLLCSLSVCWA